MDFLENTNFNNTINFWKLLGTKQAEDHPKIPENLKISWTQFITTYPLVVVTSSGILKEKQKLGITFNFDKLGDIDFSEISKLTM